MNDAATSRTATFLLTDIEGSTRLWEAHRDTMGRALAAHDALLKAAVQHSGGTVVKATGDGVLAVFDRPESAVQAAIDGQRSLASEAWPSTGPLHVRMAIHAGVAETRDGDWHGPVLNRTARLLSLGHGGQVLLSGAAAALVEDALPADVSLLDRGQHRLRDIEHPERIFQLAAPGLERDFPEFRSSRPRTNLPAELTSFIGRERQLDAADRLLRANRLVTLVGVGGTGKTRLMLRAGQDATDRFDDGVWLVELAPITEPALVATEVARALAVPDAPGQTTTETLIDYLREKQLLLLLDNCEHLIETVADLVHRLLAGCPDLRILATSREGLGVDGEAIHQVPSLSLPATLGDPDDRDAVTDLDAEQLDAVRSAEAVRLFTDRARATNPAFEVDASTADAVIEICRRLDGIPLAIELAAARVNVLSAAEIARGLGDRFGLLTGGRRTSVPRQQTLQALIDWSWDLLSSDDQRRFARMSVLVGEWTLDAAVAITADPGDGPSARIAAIDGLARLVDRSLVVSEHGEPTTYRMLETIRQYARDRLLASGEASEIRDRHYEWFRGVAMAAAPHLDGPDLAEWLRRLDREIDNLRTALDWAYETDVEAALELTQALAGYWRYRSAGAEATDRMEQAIAALDALPPPSPSGALARSTLAARLLTSAVMTVTTTGGWYEQAVPWAKRAIALARESGDSGTLLAAQDALGLAGVFESTGESVDWAAQVEEGLRLAEDSGRWGQYSVMLAGIALEVAPTDPEWSTELLARAEETAQRSGNPAIIAFVTVFTGRSDAYRGRLDEARRAFAEAIAASEEIGDRRQVLVTRSDLAHTLRRGGALDEAEAVYRQTIAEWRHLGQRGAVAHQLESFAFLASARGDARRAAILLAAADRLREVAGTPMAAYERGEYEQEVASVRAALGDVAFDAARAEGRALSTDEAVALATAG